MNFLIRERGGVLTTLKPETLQESNNDIKSFVQQSHRLVLLKLIYCLIFHLHLQLCITN